SRPSAPGGSIEPPSCRSPPGWGRAFPSRSTASCWGRVLSTGLPSSRRWQTSRPTGRSRRRRRRRGATRPPQSPSPTPQLASQTVERGTRPDGYVDQEEPAIPTAGTAAGLPAAEPLNGASPKLKIPPSAAASQYPPPLRVELIATTGERSRKAPVEP